MAWCPPKSRSAPPLPAPTDLPLTDAARWNFQYSPGMELKPEPHSEGFLFKLPSLPASAHYLVTGLNRPLAAQLTTDVEFVFTGEVALAAKDPNDTPPCFTRFYFQRAGDDGRDEFGRWFAMADQVEIQPGRFARIVPLDPARWTSVMGKKGDTNPEAFRAAAANCGVAGLVFGGKSFAGHGVALSKGAVQCIIRSYTA
jgi:hypothetical protein